MSGEEHGRRRRWRGVILLAVLIALVAGVVLGYTGAFVSVVPVTVRAGRAGLLMNPGAAVTLRGINVGEVRGVTPDAKDGRFAELNVALDPEQVAHIPANVTAHIAAPTLFGPKYVELDLPTNPSAQRVQRDMLIQTTSVGTETNDLLGDLNTLLTSVDAAKLNSALGGLSTALQGRGDRLGALLVGLNQYLRQLNPSVPVLTKDLAAAGDVTNSYADIAPDLVRILDNLSVTSQTLTDERDALPALLSSLVKVSYGGRDLLGENGDQLENLLHTLRPTSTALGEYSPMFPCLFASLNQLRGDLDKIFGYQYPAIHTFSSFLPGSQGYQVPRDLPKVIPHPPVTCYGGPLQPSDAPFPHVIFEDGWKGFVRSDGVTLGVTPPVSNPLPGPLRAPKATSPGTSPPISVPELLGGLPAPGNGSGAGGR